MTIKAYLKDWTNGNMTTLGYSWVDLSSFLDTSAHVQLTDRIDDAFISGKCKLWLGVKDPIPPYTPFMVNGKCMVGKSTVTKFLTQDNLYVHDVDLLEATAFLNCLLLGVKVYSKESKTWENDTKKFVYIVELINTLYPDYTLKIKDSNTSNIATLDYLNEESKIYFEEVKSSLESLGIPFIEDSTLVRGLDYYSHTVFEIISDIPELGKANTLCGGGRYDGLVELLGGPSTPGIGFAMGIERIIILLKELECYVPDRELDVFVMNLDNTNYAFQIIDDLRLSRFSVETDYTGKNMKGMWKLVDKLNPKFVLIIGEDERVNDYITVKDNITKEETKVKTSDLIDYLNTNI